MSTHRVVFSSYYLTSLALGIFLFWREHLPNNQRQPPDSRASATVPPTLPFLSASIDLNADWQDAKCSCSLIRNVEISLFVIRGTPAFPLDVPAVVIGLDVLTLLRADIVPDGADIALPLLASSSTSGVPSGAPSGDTLSAIPAPAASMLTLIRLPQR